MAGLRCKMDDLPKLMQCAQSNDKASENLKFLKTLLLVTGP